MPAGTRSRRVTPRLSARVNKSASIRGRCSATNAKLTEAQADPPRKRGRPPKVEMAKPVALVKNTSKAGRPRKTNFADDHHAVNSPRAVKNTRPANQSQRVNSGMDSRLRSGLRPRVSPMQKGKKNQAIRAQAPVRKRGRPAKNSSKALSSKSVTSRETTIHVPPKRARKHRGFTMLEIPDKFLAPINDFLQELIDKSTSNSVVPDQGSALEGEHQVQSSTSEQREDITQQNEDHEHNQEQEREQNENKEAFLEEDHKDATGNTMMTPWGYSGTFFGHSFEQNMQ